MVTRPPGERDVADVNVPVFVRVPDGPFQQAAAVLQRPRKHCDDTFSFARHLSDSPMPP